MDISETIRVFRKREGITQKKLADLTGLSIATIQGYEQGKYRPKIEALQKIASALNVSITDLDDRSEFTTTHLQNELKILNQKELDELEQLPTEEWFGEEWNQIRNKYEKQKTAIQKKIDSLLQEKIIDKEGFFTYAGERIKYIREKKNISQETLSVLTNIPMLLLRKYENKQRTPSFEHIYLIAQALHVPIVDILPFKSECLTCNFEEDTRYRNLIATYNLLNKNGQQKILEQLGLIAKITEYLEDEN